MMDQLFLVNACLMKLWEQRIKKLRNSPVGQILSKLRIISLNSDTWYLVARFPSSKRLEAKRVFDKIYNRKRVPTHSTKTSKSHLTR